MTLEITMQWEIKEVFGGVFLIYKPKSMNKEPKLTDFQFYSLKKILMTLFFGNKGKIERNVRIIG